MFPIPLVKKKSGLTLVELLVVMAILAILAAIVIPIIQGMRESAKSTNATKLLEAVEHHVTLGEFEEAHSLCKQDPDSVDHVFKKTGLSLPQLLHKNVKKRDQYIAAYRLWIAFEEKGYVSGNMPSSRSGFLAELQAASNPQTAINDDELKHSLIAVVGSNNSLMWQSSGSNDKKKSSSNKQLKAATDLAVAEAAKKLGKTAAELLDDPEVKSKLKELLEKLLQIPINLAELVGEIVDMFTDFFEGVGDWFEDLFDFGDDDDDDKKDVEA